MAVGHLWLHGQYREHHRNVVDHRRNDTERDIGPGRVPLVVHHVRQQSEIAHEAKTANAHDDTIEEQQGVPLSPGDPVEHIEGDHAAELLELLPVALLGIDGALAVQRLGQALAQIEAKELQIAQSGHHAKHRRQVQQGVAGNGGGHREQEQDDDAACPTLELHRLLEAVRGAIVDEEAHHHRRDHKVDQRGNQQFEELLKFDQAGLPDHQGGDVAEGAEGATCVGCDHDVDTAEIDEALVTFGHLGHHRTHQQRRGQVVGDRRDDEGKAAGEPEQGAVAEAFLDHPGTQAIEDPALVHGVDVGHRYQQEQHQLGEFQQRHMEGMLGLIRHTGLHVGPADQRPDKACRHQHGLGLAHVQLFFRHHQGVGQHEDGHRQKAGEGAGEVEFSGHRLAGSRQGEPHQQQSGEDEPATRSSYPLVVIIMHDDVILKVNEKGRNRRRDYHSVLHCNMLPKARWNAPLVGVVRPCPVVGARICAS